MKKVIIPVDFSDNSKLAARLAFNFHKKEVVDYVFYHTYSIPLTPEAIPEITYGQMVKEIKESSLTNLKLFGDDIVKMQDLDPNLLNLEYVVEESFMFAEALALFAKKQKANLVVMGTKGASGLKKLFLGSNTTSFINKAPCPLMVVPPDYTVSPILKVGYATNLANLHDEVSRLTDIFRYTGALIDIVHVYPNFPESVSVTSFDVAKELAKLKNENMFFDMQFIFQKTESANETTEGIMAYQEQYQPDMMAVFTVHRSFFDKIFDPSIAESLTGLSSKPLIILPAK